MSISAPQVPDQDRKQNEQAESRQYIDSDTERATLAGKIFMG